MVSIHKFVASVICQKNLNYYSATQHITDTAVTFGLKQIWLQLNLRMGGMINYLLISKRTGFIFEKR